MTPPAAITEDELREIEATISLWEQGDIDIVSPVIAALRQAWKERDAASWEFDIDTNIEAMKRTLAAAEAVVEAARNLYSYTGCMDGLGQSGIFYRGELADALSAYDRQGAKT